MRLIVSIFSIVDRFGGLAILGSFKVHSVASRGKRGPVAFRPNLFAGLPMWSLFPKRSRVLGRLHEYWMNKRIFERQ